MRVLGSISLYLKIESKLRRNKHGVGREQEGSLHGLTLPRRLTWHSLVGHVSTGYEPCKLSQLRRDYFARKMDGESRPRLPSAQTNSGAQSAVHKFRRFPDFPVQYQKGMK